VKAQGSILVIGKEFSLHFCHYYTLIYHFLAKPGIIKITNSKLDLVRYPQFCYEIKIECKYTVGKFS
jgi:hypothetical protein